MRRKTRSDPESVTHTVMVYILKCIAAFSTWVGFTRTGDHERSAHIQVAQLCGAPRRLRPRLLGARRCYGHNQDDDSPESERNQRFCSCHCWIYICLFFELFFVLFLASFMSIYSTCLIPENCRCLHE